MSVLTADPSSPSRSSRGAAVLALARLEATRVVRHPLVALGLAVSVWAVLTTHPQEEGYPGDTYATTMVLLTPFLAAVTLAVASAFHRERQDVGSTTPLTEQHRLVARLLATVPFVVVAGAFAALVWWRWHQVGGMLVGHPEYSGDTRVHSWAELSQFVALTVFAVGAGAALGRRAARPAVFVAALVVGWFMASVSWLYGYWLVAPFAVIRTQPAYLDAGPRGTDPATFPADWRLNRPNLYTDHWERLYLSDALAWWHDLWLVGLAVVLVSAAMPGGRARGWVVVLGAAAAVAGVAGQFAVLP